MSNDPYIGVGVVYMREAGAAAPLVDVGNTISAVFSPSPSNLSQPNYRTTAGGSYAEIDRIESMGLNLEIGGLRKDNFAKAALGSTSAITSGTVTDEVKTAYLGGLIKLDKLPSSITDVNSAPLGAGTSYTVGTDYTVTPGGIFIPSGSAIPDAGTVYITYDNKASDMMEALTQSQKEYEIIFDGQNAADSAGKAMTVHIYKVKLSASEVPLIGDDFMTLNYEGKLLPDLTKDGITESQYYSANIEQ